MLRVIFDGLEDATQAAKTWVDHLAFFESVSNDIGSFGILTPCEINHVQGTSRDWPIRFVTLNNELENAVASARVKIELGAGFLSVLESFIKKNLNIFLRSYLLFHRLEFLPVLN